MFTFREPTDTELDFIPGEDTLRELLDQEHYLRIHAMLRDDVLTGWYYVQLSDGQYCFESVFDSITTAIEQAAQQLAIRCFAEADPALQHHRPMVTPSPVAEHVGSACEYCAPDALAHSDNGRPIYPPGTPTLPPGDYTQREVLGTGDEYPTPVWVQDGTDEPWTIGDDRCMVAICPKHNSANNLRVLSEEEAKRYNS